MGNERNILPDTPWHLGYAKMAENDIRRDKRRCIYYSNGICRSTNCGCYNLRCGGSSHCLYYNEGEKRIWRERTELLSKKLPRLFWRYSLYATCECLICGHQIELIENKNQHTHYPRYCPYCEALYVSRKFWKKHRDIVCFPMNPNVIEKQIIIEQMKLVPLKGRKINWEKIEELPDYWEDPLAYQKFKLY